MLHTGLEAVLGGHWPIASIGAYLLGEARQRLDALAGRQDFGSRKRFAHIVFVGMRVRVGRDVISVRHFFLVWLVGTVETACNDRTGCRSPAASAPGRHRPLGGTRGFSS